MLTYPLNQAINPSAHLVTCRTKIRFGFCTCRMRGTRRYFHSGLNLSRSVQDTYQAHQRKKSGLNQSLARFLPIFRVGGVCRILTPTANYWEERNWHDGTPKRRPRATLEVTELDMGMPFTNTTVFVGSVLNFTEKTSPTGPALVLSKQRAATQNFNHI